MEKIRDTLLFLLVAVVVSVVVASLMPVPVQASCTYLCAPIYCSDGQYWFRSGGGDAYILLRYSHLCNGGTCSPSGCYIYCQEYPCASLTGTLYTTYEGKIMAVQITDRTGRVADFIEHNRKHLSAETMLRVLKTNFGVDGKLMTLEAFNNRPVVASCPA